MDAGGVALVGAIAAVVGAAVGAGGAIGAAAVTGRQQARAQHFQWRRQVRRDAYAAFLTHAGEVTASLRSVQSGKFSGSPDPSAARRATLDRADSAVLAMQKAGMVVVLEGPLTVSRAASSLTKALLKYRTAVAETASGQSPPPLVREAYQDVTKKLGTFQEAASEVVEAESRP